MIKVNCKGGSNELVLKSSSIALALTTIVMISESMGANAFRSDGCLDLEGLKSAQQYLSGYMDAHHDFISGFVQKNPHNHDNQTLAYVEGYNHGWSDAQHGVLNSEC